MDDEGRGFLAHDGAVGDEAQALDVEVETGAADGGEHWGLRGGGIGGGIKRMHAGQRQSWVQSKWGGTKELPAGVGRGSSARISGTYSLNVRL